MIDKEPTAITARQDNDIVLQMLAKLAQDNTDFEVSLTLMVPGATVSGLLIGRDRWFKEATVWMDSYRDGAGSVASAFGSVFAEDAPERGHDLVSFNFLHLKDAHIVAAGVRMGDGMFWRGRISEVAGFSFGALKVS